ncbi:MFS transporter [Streptomyces sp. AK02-01A]|uniref:MFS transporter n=1 Tax=Streptomyces sp. AK02-01A TaxID=3028648 RepID=UPI0029B18193|nr:MFS transporter [Streptomyces sp. AK02-01A]MDX3851325.1 MFS transporter [Streptomyces sp. AK02-01A]
MHSSRGTVGPSIGARLDRLPVTARHKRFVNVMALGNFFEIYELFLTSVLLSTLKKTFALNGFSLSLFLASTVVGGFLGAVVVGRVADKIGRRGAYMITLSLYSAGTIACACAPNVWTLIACRFVIGIGLGGELPVTDSYLADILPPARRGYYAARAYTCAHVAVPVVGVMGLLLVDRAPFGVAGWRWMFAIGSLGALLTFFARRGLPESPRWLETVGRRAEADKVTTTFEKSAEAEGWRPPLAVMNEETVPPPVEKRLPVRMLFQAPLARRTALMAFLWALGPIGYYGFSALATLSLEAKGFDLSSSLTFMTLSFLGSPIGSYLSMHIVERAERKWILCVALVIMAAIGLAYGYAQSAVMITVLGFCFTVVANIKTNATHIYQLEQFPTSLRTTANGWLFSLNRLSSAAAPFYMVPLFYGAGVGAVFIVGATAMLLAATAVAFGVRTRGLSLENINTASRPEGSPTAIIPSPHTRATTRKP